MEKRKEQSRHALLPEPSQHVLPRMSLKTKYHTNCQISYLKSHVICFAKHFTSTLFYFSSSRIQYKSSVFCFVSILLHTVFL